jgi:hypothetical protein
MDDLPQIGGRCRFIEDRLGTITDQAKHGAGSGKSIIPAVHALTVSARAFRRAYLRSSSLVATIDEKAAGIVEH